MASLGALSERLDAVLDTWLARIESHGVHMAPIGALRAELSGWLEPLARDPAPETDELLRQVALHARELGADGKPASAVIMQVSLLEEALRENDVPVDPLRAALREMSRVVADAHALGARTRLERQFAKTVAGAPVVRVPGRAVVAFMVGEMTPELIDTMVGRLLRVSAGAEEPLTVLDVSAAARDGEVFHRSLHGFATGAQFSGLILHVTGLEDPAATQAALDALGVPAGRVHLHPTLEAALAPDEGA